MEAIDETGRTGWGGIGVFFSVVYRRNDSDMRAYAERFFIPNVVREFFHPSEVPDSLARFKGNRMAKAGLESAVWDLYAKKKRYHSQKP